MDIFQVGLKQFWLLLCFSYDHRPTKNGWFWGQKQVTMAGSSWLFFSTKFTFFYKVYFFCKVYSFFLLFSHNCKAGHQSRLFDEQQKWVSLAPSVQSSANERDPAGAGRRLSRGGGQQGSTSMRTIDSFSFLMHFVLFHFHFLFLCLYQWFEVTIDNKPSRTETVATAHQTILLIINLCSAYPKRTGWHKITNTLISPGWRINLAKSNMTWSSLQFKGGREV